MKKRMNEMETKELQWTEEDMKQRTEKEKQRGK
jgi:hypothetical protein